MITKTINAMTLAFVFAIIMIQRDELGELLIAGHKALLYAAVTCAVVFLINLTLLAGDVFGGLEDFD